MTASNRRGRFPFLHRNYIKSTNHWHVKMGNKTSSLSPNSGDRFPDPDDQLTHQQQNTHKRRRLKLNSEVDGFPLFANYADTAAELRVDILKINHKDAPRLKNGILNGLVAPTNVNSMRARCKITIFTPKGGQQLCMHVDSQLCDIKIYKNPAGSTPIARLSAIQSFKIPAEKIYLQGDDERFGLANSYGLLVELESAGDSKWPPTELIPMNDDDTFSNRILPSREWVLTATVPNIYDDRHCKTMRLKVRKHSNHETMTNFLLDVDARWITAISRDLTMKQEKDILPEITVFDPDHPHPPVQHVIIPANGVTGIANIDDAHAVNGHVAGPLANGEVDTLAVQTNAGPDAADDLAEGELTPSRSRRTRRMSLNYNVRQLWNTAVGKDKVKKRRRSDEKPDQQDEHTVTYKLHPEQVRADKYQCIMCAAEHERMSQLRAHVLNSHPNYEFQFENKAAEGWVVGVRAAIANSEEEISLRASVYQLGLPTKPLDLDSFVDGDTSWVDSRLGPDNVDMVQKKPLQSRPVQVSTHKRDDTPSLDVTIKIEDSLNLDALHLDDTHKDDIFGDALTKTQHRVPRRPKRKVLVPNIKQPLFDPLSKAQLVPGTEIRQLPVDDEWLILKHRDTLQDFTDVEESEKDYMKEWDAFILQRHLSSEAYLGRAFLAFVKEKANWIIARQTRAEEFSKHVAVLLARQAIDDMTLQDATTRLNEARTAKATAVPEPPKPEPPKQRDPSDCAVCGQLVAVSAMLICGNKVCTPPVLTFSNFHNPGTNQLFFLLSAMRT